MWCKSTASAYIPPFIVCYTKRIAVYPGRRLRFFEICSVWLWASGIDVYLELQTISLLCGPSQLAVGQCRGHISLRVLWSHEKPWTMCIKKMSYSEFTRWPFMKREVGYWDIWLMLLFSPSKHTVSFHLVNSLWTCFYFPSIWLRRLLFSVLLSENVALMHANQSSLKMLDSVYHASLRFVTKSSFRTHHCSLYESVGWLSLHNRRLEHWYIFLFKDILYKLPSYLCSLLTLKVTTSKCNLRSYGQIMYDIPRTRTVFGESAFKFLHLYLGINCRII